MMSQATFRPPVRYFLVRDDRHAVMMPEHLVSPVSVRDQVAELGSVRHLIYKLLTIPFVHAVSTSRSGGRVIDLLPSDVARAEVCGQQRGVAP